MPSTTRTFACDEYLLADAWMHRSRSYGETRVDVLHRIRDKGTTQSALKDNYGHALCFYVPRSKYHAFVRLRPGVKYRVKRQRRKVISSLPQENIAAIRLLDSWLNMPETRDDAPGERLRQLIDENRLSDRKFFT